MYIFSLDIFVQMLYYIFEERRASKLKDRIKEIRNNNPNGKTQDSFSDFLGIPKQNLASYETGRRKPSDAVIKLICEKCNISEEWLRTGNGEMYIPLSKDDELAKMFADLIKKDESNFCRRLITAMLKLDESGWKAIEEFANKFLEK